jgi:hypothetical protein
MCFLYRSLLYWEAAVVLEAVLGEAENIQLTCGLEKVCCREMLRKKRFYYYCKIFAPVGRRKLGVLGVF